MPNSESQTFAVTGEPLKAVRKIAATRGISEGEALRYCISYGAFFEEQRVRGNDVIIRDPSGSSVYVDMEPEAEEDA